MFISKCSPVIQVLSIDLCEALCAQAINIHYSLLLSFKGTCPRHRAFELGRKLLGATAHFLTANLDEQPVIKQAVL